MASFNSVEFNERGGGGGKDFPVRGAKASYAEYVIPGGTSVFVKVGMVQQVIAFPGSGDYTTVENLRNSVGITTSLNGSIGGDGQVCTLVELTNIRQVIDGVDLYFFDLQLSFA